MRRAWGQGDKPPGAVFPLLDITPGAQTSLSWNLHTPLPGSILQRADSTMGDTSSGPTQGQGVIALGQSGGGRQSLDSHAGVSTAYIRGPSRTALSQGGKTMGPESWPGGFTCTK